MAEEGLIQTEVTERPDQWTPKRLNQRHLRMVELALAGLPRRDIALAMAMTPEAVGLVMASGLFQEELSRRRVQQQRKTDSTIAGATSRAMEKIAVASERAVDVLVDTLDDPDTRVRQAACNSILDRAGIGAKATSSTPVVHISAERIQLLLNAFGEVSPKETTEAA